ncbi:MAG: methyltransferase domain-containing protein [Deltaproteobacteria bacterium]|nr:methyltransferase domain-containing protein [Deltaproteobacteria bacterium]
MTFLAPPELDLDDPRLIATLDDVPLWSAPFGLALLATVRLRPKLSVLEVGCGTGFPLVELAQRLGPTCHLVGLDPWRAALDRAAQKIEQVGLGNVELVCGSAEQMPFPDQSFGLVVSNNGLSNVADLDQALAECARVCTPGAQLVTTHNLPETMAEVYQPYAAILRSMGRQAEVERLGAHIHDKRKTVAEMTGALVRHGFERVVVTEDVFHMRFIDGSTMLQHFLIRLGFLEPWKAILEPADVDEVLARLTEHLDEQARQDGELRLTVPFACIDAVARPEGANRSSSGIWHGG